MITKFFRGYLGCFQQRSGDKSDGCAIFWRSTKLRRVRQRALEFNISPRFDRDNVALLVELEPLEPDGLSAPSVPGEQLLTRESAAAGGGGLVVATTHLLFNPKRGDIKLQQAAAPLNTPVAMRGNHFAHGLPSLRVSLRSAGIAMDVCLCGRGAC